MATCCTIAEPSELPTIRTGGVQTASISSATSRANDSIGHGPGTSHTVSPMPRLSNVVDRWCGSKKSVWNRRQSRPSVPPPPTHTRSSTATRLLVGDPSF